MDHYLKKALQMAMWLATSNKFALLKRYAKIR